MCSSSDVAICTTPPVSPPPHPHPPPPTPGAELCSAFRPLSLTAGAAASELYVVRSGQFEVLQRPPGAARGAGGAAALVRVNTKGSGSAFGELALLYSQPRTATVAALADSVVWVLERGVLR